MTLHYKIEFHSPWHCGAGLSAGADLDALVVKDKDRLPYIPGKTLKGLIRQAVEEYAFFTKNETIDITQLFGQTDAADPNDIIKGDAFFTNAELDIKEREVIVHNQLQPYLYDNIASTAIDDSGIALDHSLRRKEVVLPCTLYAEIHFLNDDQALFISKAMGMIKQMGVNRSRGLGRCTFCVIKEK